MDTDEGNEDEEVNIDFSKIKNLFRRKKKVREEVKEVKSEEKIEEPKKEGTKESPEEKEEEIKKEEPKQEMKETKEESEENDEINIDFSKIKNLFKSKKEEKTETKASEEGEDEEISFDFSKIKNIFKRSKEKKSEEEKDEEEISLDVKKTVDFFNKHKKVFIPTLLIIITIFLSVYLRVQPAYLPATDDWARNSVYNQIKSSIKGQIDQQYPNLPDANKNSLVDAEFKKILKEQKAQINQQIEGTSDFFKTRLQDDKGQTYLLAIDPYFWMRHAKNVLENGHPGDELRDGRPYDSYMYAPVGRGIPPDMFHAYFEAYLYKFLHFFNRNLDLMALAFYVPVILSALCIFPAFFIGKRLAGNFGGFISAFIIAIHPAFLTRTAGGFADTDAYNVLFPLFITWLFLEAFETENKRKRIIYSSLAGLLVGLFSSSWGGWFYIFDFIIAASIFYLCYFIILHREEIKNIALFIKKPTFYNPLTSILIFILSSAIFTSIFTSFSNFRNAFLIGPLSFVRLKQVAITTIWPNVYTTVAEQNPASLNSVISQIGIGSTLLFLIGLTGIALTMLRKETKKASDLWFAIGSIVWFIIILGIRPQNLTLFLGLISLPIIIKLIIIIKDKDKEVDIKAAILLILWFTSTIYASTKGVRFILLGVPAFAIALGVALGIGYYYLHRLITQGLKINKNISKALVIIVLCLLLLGPYRSAKATVKNEIPSMNDDWYNSLKKIDLEAQPDAIINSWWDFGHWFKAIGNRAVTFDGTSQNSPNAHWIGSVLLTDDESYAVGTLRMVDCGQNKAFKELDKIIKDGAKSIDILEEIVRLDKKEASSNLLKKGLSEEESDNVSAYTHCEPPENYFITSYDMVGKSGVWGHFGSWNFDRSLIYNTLKKKEYKDDLEKSISFLQDRFNYTRTEAESIYYDIQSITTDKQANDWIAPWPGYSGSGSCSKIEKNMISCGIGGGGQVEINLKTLQADIQTAQGIKHPNSVVLPLEDGSYRKREFNDTIGVSLTLIPTGDESYTALILNPQLASSMFTIMFYLNGHGLKYFDKFSDVRDITGGRIIIWKVNWQGNSTNLLEYYQPEPVPEEKIEDEPEEELVNKSGEIIERENISSGINDSQDTESINKSEEIIEEENISSGINDSQDTESINKSEEIIEEENISSGINDSQDINTVDNSSE